MISKLSGQFTGISESSLINDCNQAITWAQSRGLNVSNVDGVRYINGGAQTTAFIMIIFVLRNFKLFIS